MVQRQQSTHQYLAGIHPVAGIAVHHTHDSHVDQVDGEAHPGQGHPGRPREDGVDRAAGPLDARQDHPGEGEGPGQPVEAAIEHPLCQGGGQGGILLVGDQPVNDQAANQEGNRPDPGQGHWVEGKFGLLLHLVEDVTKTETDEIWLEPGNHKGSAKLRHVFEESHLHQGTM